MRKTLKILRDVDERGGGSSIFDIFSMDFEGDSTAPATSPEVVPAESPSEPSVPETSPEQESSTTSSAIDNSEVSQSTDGGSQVEEHQVSEPQNPEPKPAPSASAAPSSDALLAEAMKAIANLTEKKEEPKVEAPEEDEDTKVFKAREFSDYTFNITPKLYNGLFNPEASEEERVFALQGFASGIATTVHNRILESFGAWTREQFQSVPGVVNYLLSAREKAQGSAKMIRDDFYGSFPELNKPELAPLVKATIQSVQKETKAKMWTPQIKNIVGARVKSVLAAYAQAAGGVKQVAPKVTKVSASPAPAVNNKVDPNSTDAILDVLSSDF